MAGSAHPCLSSPVSNFWVLPIAGNWGVEGEQGVSEGCVCDVPTKMEQGRGRALAFVPCSNFPASAVRTKLI